MVILRIADKVFVAVLLLSAVVIIAMAIATRIGIGRSFTAYVARAELQRLDDVALQLQQAWRQHGSWAFLPPPTADGTPPDLPTVMAALAEPVRAGAGGEPGGAATPAQAPAPGRPPQPGPAAGPGRSPGAGARGEAPLSAVDLRPPPDRLGLIERGILLDGDGKVLAGQPPAPGSSGRAIRVDGVLVGMLALAPLPQLTDQLDVDFLAEQSLMLWIIAIIALSLSGGTALLLSRHFLAPLTAITNATRALARGQFATRLQVTRHDELGQLQSDFNSLAHALETMEQSRRQWVADTSHELRTPLAVLRGEIEALVDGVHQPTPKVLETLHEEVLHMGKLIEDLYELARSDLGRMSFRMQEVDPLAPLLPVLALYAERLAAKGLALESPLPASGAVPAPGGRLIGDPDRLRQVYVNILENSWRYSDPGGRVVVTQQREADQWIVTFDDTAPGVPAELLGRLFERFFRAEASRNRARGGSGLGLAISRAIVEAHGGTLTAQASPLGGLRLVLSLPLLAGAGAPARRSTSALVPA